MKTSTPSGKRRNERDMRIIQLVEKYRNKYSTKLELYLYIGRQVGCSHITVYRVIRNYSK